MASTKIEQPKTVNRVDLFVPRAMSKTESPNEFISVNGINYVLPKGKVSRVPDYVADEYYRAEEAKIKLDERMDALAIKE